MFDTDWCEIINSAFMMIETEEAMEALDRKIKLMEEKLGNLTRFLWICYFRTLSYFIDCMSTRVAGAAKLKLRSSLTSQIIDLQDKTLEAALQFASVSVERERLKWRRAMLVVEKEMNDMKVKLLTMGFI
jgi:hypothetical protein